MPRKGKEPAGLRRYRLAQKRKKRGGRTRRVRRVKRRPTMARRKRRGGKKQKSIPLAPVLPVAIVAYKDLTADVSIEQKLNNLCAHTTGYSPLAMKFDADWAKGFWVGELAGIVVHKVANGTGVNRYIRKATMGYLSL